MIEVGTGQLATGITSDRKLCCRQAGQTAEMAPWRRNFEETQHMLKTTCHERVHMIYRVISRANSRA